MDGRRNGHGREAHIESFFSHLKGGSFDTITGELARAGGAGRSGRGPEVPRRGFEVALETTTGWRFLVEELERIGADRAPG
jgi:hypothetical protein